MAVLKSDNLKDVDKKLQIEAMLQNKIDNENFNEIYNISKEINDYTADIEEDVKFHQIDEEIRINVQFDDEIEEEEDEDLQQYDQRALKDDYQYSDESDKNDEVDEEARSLPDSELEDNVI